MALIRKYAALDGAGQIVVCEEECPEPKPGQLLVKVRASLVSPGTELGGVKQRRENPGEPGTPRMFGYQNAGEVIGLGEGCEEIARGRRVACMGGGYAPHASYGCCPRNLCTLIPEGVSYEQAAFNHLAATSLQAVRRAQPELGEYFVVLGLGLVGQMAAQLLRLSGARVMGWDRIPLRLDIAAKTGTHRPVNVAEEDVKTVAKEFTRGWGVDGGIIAFGGEASEAFKALVGVMKVSPDGHEMGRISIVGGAQVTATWAAGLGNLDIRSSARTGPGYHDEDWEHGKDYPPVFMQWNTKRNLEECLRLIQEGRLDVCSLITDEVPLEEAPAACDKLIEHPDQAMGVILKPTH
ncbi:MAG: hypothetical protein COZ06_19115 [Armatimonadetes bacterium CG_4_10_14_3_um_filter_66_18]|nr:MAG: hypothetical protein COZ06_19115 [Armatimonadetes bacterium CG_4_10_14_3_um_filter_66_18]